MQNIFFYFFLNQLLFLFFVLHQVSRRPRALALGRRKQAVALGFIRNLVRFFFLIYHICSSSFKQQY
ncbi:MAG: hypothetical protein [CRESS virus sp. ctYls24]|nr:MAG: hypothetical protein [CRESS virus sp. ctYls24]